MSRAERRLELLQRLRHHPHPVSGAALAAELGVSLRTLYRDVASLQAQGAWIEGEPGLGYVLRPGFMLPPLMFSEEEIHAVALGARWVAGRADAALALAARDALAKIAAALPADLRRDLEASAPRASPRAPLASDGPDLPAIRSAIRAERKLAITYVDLRGVETRRVIWPFALAFLDRVRVVASWCELRQAYRQFRTERIAALTASQERYPRRRHALLKEWRDTGAIPPQ